MKRGFVLLIAVAFLAAASLLMVSCAAKESVSPVSPDVSLKLFSPNWKGVLTPERKGENPKEIGAYLEEGEVGFLKGEVQLPGEINLVPVEGRIQKFQEEIYGDTMEIVVVDIYSLSQVGDGGRFLKLQGLVHGSDLYRGSYILNDRPLDEKGKFYLKKEPL